MAIGQDGTAFESIGGGGFAFAGKTTARTMLRLWTITDEDLLMSLKNAMRPVHPGEILREELDELGMSAKAFAEALAVPPNRISAILNQQRGVTADTALRVGRYLGTTPEFWLNLQKSYELREAEIETGRDIAKCVKPRKVAA